MNLVSGWNDELVNVSDLNQFLYCPRRLYYLMFYQTQGINEYLADGRGNHARQSRRGGWIREMYIRSEGLHLHGKIDIVDINNGFLPIERKRGDRFFDNDLVQLCAYAILLEEFIGKSVETGIIYLYGTGKRHEIRITDELKERVYKTINEIKGMDSDFIPDFVDNRNKCKKCSVLLYCLPNESEILEGDNV